MGYCIMLNCSAVAWRSKHEPIVALLTAESEYVAACYSTQEIVSLRRLLKRLAGTFTLEDCKRHSNPDADPQSNPTCVYEDNRACLLLAGEPVLGDWSKHIDVSYHFLRDKVREGEVQLIACSTQNMVADVLTKPLGAVKFHQFVRTMMNLLSSPAASTETVEEEEQDDDLLKGGVLK
eukprot:1440533-Rhodomonas_salina.1